MYATVQKWGNSQGLRIPKGLLNALNIRENDRVELVQKDNAIIITKAPPIRHRSLEERLVAFYGKPLDEIEARTEDRELDWGAPKGSEEW